MRGQIFLKVHFLLSFCSVGVICFSEKLSGESVLYGVASLTEKYSKDKSSKCLHELNVFYEAVEKRRIWALKALDASGKPQTGFLYGNNLWLGSHAHCSDISNKKPLEINHEKAKHPPPTMFDYPPYPIKFVKVFIKHNNTLQLHTQLPFDFTIQIGLCVPKNCSNKDIFLLFDEYLNKDYLNMKNLYNLSLRIERVKTLEEDSSFMLHETSFIVLISVMGVVVLLSIIGTIYDVKRHFKNKKYIHEFRQNIVSKVKEKNVSEIELFRVSQEPLNQKEPLLLEIARCFSIYSNTKALVNTKLSSDSISCIHGIRFFGMMWVCMIHSIFYQADYVTDPAYAYRISEDMSSQVFTNSTYSVDTYLLISGFLLAYLFYKTSKMGESKETVNYLRKFSEFCMMCFHRIIRLTPAYLIVILLCDVFYTYLRRTSSLESHEAPDILCPKYWWRNILYINNLFPRSEMCLSWSWYLSVDTQAFLISAILLIVSTFAFKTAVVSLFVFIMASIVATSFKSYSIGYIPTMDDQLAHLDDIYDLPWNRIGPYLVGIAAGYILMVKLKSKLILGQITRIFLSILCAALLIWIVFTLHTRKLSVEFSAVYMGISRTLWGVGLAWIIIGCSTGNIFYVNKFLSFPGWIPMSRLTFCAYLMNPLVANTLYLLSENVYNSSKAGFGITMIGVTMATFFWAFLVSIFFESPFILLTKIILRYMTGPQAKKQSKNSSSDNPQ